MILNKFLHVKATKGVIGEVWCGFLRIYAPTPYSVVFLLPAPAPAPNDRFWRSAVRYICGLTVWARLIWVGLDQPKCQF